jgi:hypothetical protein
MEAFRWVRDNLYERTGAYAQDLDSVTETKRFLREHKLFGTFLICSDVRSPWKHEEQLELFPFQEPA